jgi:hypothetical protein
VRLVLDTNVALSGLLWQGTPGKLIDACQARQIELASSAPLLAELHEVLKRDKFALQLAARGISAQTIFDGYAAMVTIVTPATIAPTIVEDPADDAVLACALSARADLIVSGDKRHLLQLAVWQGIPIVSASEAVKRIVA